MPKSNDLLESLHRDLDAIAKLRDELRVTLRLGRADARDEWTKLEKNWRSVQSEIKRLGTQSKGSAKEIGSAARDLMKELKAGYRRIRSQIKD